MIKILIACLAVLAFVNADDEGRIVGGQIINISQTPYLVQLRWDGQHFCGGTLVRNNFVVTAAHCLDDLVATKITVVGGASTASEAGISRKVIKAWVPDAYERVGKDMDIAVLKLSGDLTGTNIKPIPLCSRHVRPGDRLQVSGWGKISEDGPYSEHLRTVIVPTISKADCADAHWNVAKMTHSMICGSEPGVKDACTGDSGGPAVMNGELCGVVSWGIGCGREEFPGVYTGIAEALNFVEPCLEL